MTEVLSAVKHGKVMQRFTSGSCSIWCDADKLLYMYHFKSGDAPLQEGDMVTFTKKPDSNAAVLVS